MAKQSLGFEIATINELFPRHDIENILVMRNEISRDYQLDPELIEDRIRAFIFLVNDTPDLL